MGNAGPSGPGDRGEDAHDPARPYVTGPLRITSTPLAITAGLGQAADPAPSAAAGASSAFTLIEPPRPPETDTAPLPAVGLTRHRQAGGKAGRRPRADTATRRWLAALADRGPVVIGVVAGLVVIAGGVVLLTSQHAATPGTCHQGACDQAAARPPGSPVPAILPTSLDPTPPPSAVVPTRQAVSTATTPATTIVTATPRPSATGTTTSPTPSPTATNAQLTPGSWVSVQATTPCCTSFYISHDDQDNRVGITQVTAGSPGSAKADATWIVRAGLADSSCVSLESANQPGQYLRHYDFELYLEPNDGSYQFAEDATFCPRPGNSGRGYSLESVNYPSQYIRHYDYVAYIASDGGSNQWDTPTLWPDDTTFLVDQPWTASTSSGSPGSPGFGGCGQGPCHH